MPVTRDVDRIRAILARDRVWSVYALGDLSPKLFPECRWFVSQDDAGLVLLYGLGEAPVLFAAGPPEAVAPLLDEAGPESACLSIPPDLLPEVEARWEVRGLARMWRMVLNPAELRRAEGISTLATPAEGSLALRRLDMGDVTTLGHLYDDGRETGEIPDFFRLSMVREGVFIGVFHNDELVAVAGTHLVVPEEGVGAIGNVYTRRDWRGRGLATRTVAAVAEELLRLGVTTIGLNVDQTNEPAIRAYRAAGFRIHGPFYEGVAVR